MPQAALIDGRAIAGRMREQLTAVATVLRERHRVTAGLAAILVGDDPASAIYVRNKANACASVGITSSLHRLPADTAEATLIALVERLGHDDAIDGILVQLPLPAGIDARRVIAAIAPEKDIDGFHPVNVGGLWSGRPGLVPCTPQGCLILVRSVRANPAGAEVVVLGRSAIVGKPVAALLLAADCTVTLAHSYSRDLAAICRRADILIAAAGRPQIVKADWIKPGATVIDVGISRVGNRWPAGSGTAARRELHCHGSPFANARPCRDLPPRRCPRGCDRTGGGGRGRLDQAWCDRYRRWNQSDSRTRRLAAAGRGR